MVDRIGRWVVVVALAVTSTVTVAVLRDEPALAAGEGEVIAYVVEGIGNGHGRGMSQWGAFGWAVNFGWSWNQILDHYYGGTVLGDLGAGEQEMTVRLIAADGLDTVGVVNARFNGADYRSLRLVRSGSNFVVSGIPATETGMRCPSTSDLVVPNGPLAKGQTGSAVADMQRVLGFFGYNVGPIDGVFGNMTDAAVRAFQTDRGLGVDGVWAIEEADTARALIAATGSGTYTAVGTFAAPVTVEQLGPTDAGSLTGLCGSDGSVTHYRGRLVVRVDGSSTRVVNALPVEEYLRGVVPKEVSASWGQAGAGAGMNSLRAQAVAARSYGVQQNRYGYAKTCDTQSCQVYGGAARRGSVGSAAVLVEDYRTDLAIAETAGKVRRWGSVFGSIVSTEFSASNGPRTAGGTFPAVDDPADDVPGNPNHRWTRVIDASLVSAKYGALAVGSEPDPNENYDGVWDNRVRLTSGATISNWNFRNDFGLLSPGFVLRPITRDLETSERFWFIGDSVGASITESDTAELPALLDGVFGSANYDAVTGRCTSKTNCTGTNGVAAAAAVPVGTEVVVVELGYNDEDGFASRIDQVMSVLRSREVRTVAWVNMSQRRTSRAYAQANQALLAARSRWGELTVLDWNGASGAQAADRWFTDDVHLSPTGQAEFARWLRGQVLPLATGVPRPRPVIPAVPLRVPVLGQGGVPGGGVSAVALTVTAVDPSAWGFLTVWPCGSPMPVASNVNYLGSGAVEPNMVLVPVDGTGEVCVFSHASSHVLVDVAGWFDSGFHGLVPNRIVDTRNGIGAARAKVAPSSPLHVPVLAQGGVPGGGVSAVALTVTAVDPSGWGFLTVWPCGSPMPVASNVNYLGSGAVEPNMVLVPVDGTGEVCVFSHASSHVLVDVAGWFDSGFHGLVPNRIVDTRNGIGAARAKVAPSSPLHVPVLAQGGVPGGGVSAVALTVTAVDPSGWGFLTVWPCGSPMPVASNVNYLGSGAVEPNMVLVPVDGTGEVCVFSHASSHVLVDVAGWFDSGFHGLVPNRIVDTRNGIGPIPGR